MAVVLFFLSLTFLVFILSSPLFYSLFLAGLSVLVVSFIVTYYSIVRLLGVVLLLVYLGSMIILIAYVCAVVPNLSYPSPVERLWSRGLMILVAVIFCICFTFLTPPALIFTCPPHSVPVFLYSVSGVLFFSVITLLIIVVLYCCSIFTLISSPFRSY